MQRALALALVASIVSACRAAHDAPRESSRVVAVTPTSDTVPLRVPSDSAMPSGDLGASVRRGRALLLATKDSLPTHVRAAMRCASCHLDGGTRAWSSPWVGVYARFPQYRSRNAAVSVIEDRINDCFVRSMNGTALDPASREMRDIVAYFAFLSRGVPVGASVNGQGFAKLPAMRGDSARGRAIFQAQCVRCHGTNGEGTAVAPPLWGDASFNIGAGMARLNTAAAFIRKNMPFDKPGSLGDAEAYDVAAFIVGRPRPDFPGKENDWPRGDAPSDVAYPTRASRTTHR